MTDESGKGNVKICIRFCFSDGATCCGLYIVISNLIDQLQQEEELDICNAVRQVQIRRPQCIKDKVLSLESIMYF